MALVRLIIAGHIVVDTVIRIEQSETLLGGPPCYAGLAAKSLGADVALVTRFGADFPEAYYLWLVRNQLRFGSGARSLTHPTTRFRIVLQGDGRTLFLAKRCENLGLEQITGLEADGAIVSPVAGEISMEFLEEVGRMFSIVYVDPQGFLRAFEEDGKCVLRQGSLESLAFAQILKVDEEEVYAYTGVRDMVEGLRLLAKRGPEIVIGTRSSEPVLLLHRQHMYEIPVKRVSKVVDTTGAGDIFAGGFMAEYVREGDVVWAACLAGVMASSGLDKVGLAKVPSRGMVTEEAEALYARVTELEL